MAVAFRATSSVFNGTVGTPVVVPVPGVQSGDLMVAFIGQAGIASVTPPAGWTLLGTQAASTAVTLAVYYRFAAGEPASYTWTLGASVLRWGVISAYSGVDTTRPITASASNTYTTSSFSPTLPSPISVLRNGLGVSAVAGTRTATGTGTTWTPSGTERFDSSTNLGAGTDMAGFVQDSTVASADTSYGPGPNANQTQSNMVIWGLTLNPLWTVPAPGALVSTTLEAAFGADLTADPSTWTWTDITSRMRGQAQVTRGRTDESSQTQPSSCAVRLENVDAALTPGHPSSPWYQQWDLGTPMRLKVNLPVTSYIRCQGRVSSIQPDWPAGNDTTCYVDVVFKGALQALGQGSTPVHSAMYRGIRASNPIAYWPGEDASGSTSLAEASGGSAMRITGAAPTLASTGPAGSSPLVTLAGTTSLDGAVPSTVKSGWTVEFYVRIPSAPATDTPILDWYTTGVGATIAHWRFTLFTGSASLGIEAWNSSGTNVISGFTVIPAASFYGGNLFVSVAARQNGIGTVEYEFMVQTTDATTGAGGHVGGSVAGGQLGIITTVAVLGGWDHTSWVYGHIAVFDTLLDTSWGSGVFPHYLLMAGNAAEPAAYRINRMAGLAGVPLTYVDTSPGLSTSMGAELLSTPYSNMRDSESADDGVLTDGLDPGVRYLSRPGRYNLPVSLALNAKQAQVKLPFQPIRDDQRLRTSVQVARSGGSSARYTDNVSQARYGEYDDSLTLDLLDDTGLTNQASWRVGKGTIREMRVPGMVIDLRDRPELIRAWVEHMDIGARYTATGLPSQFSPNALDQVLEQYTEVIDATVWRVTLIGSPFAPWRALTLSDPTYGRLEAGSSTLASGVTAKTTGTLDTLSVATSSGPLCTTTATYPADFPVDIDVEGERITVTAIVGSSSPQSFSVIRAMNGIVKAHGAGAKVSLWQPAGLAL